MFWNAAILTATGAHIAALSRAISPCDDFGNNFADSLPPWCFDSITQASNSQQVLPHSSFARTFQAYFNIQE